MGGKSRLLTVYGGDRLFCSSFCFYSANFLSKLASKRQVGDNDKQPKSVERCAVG